MQSSVHQEGNLLLWKTVINDKNILGRKLELFIHHQSEGYLTSWISPEKLYTAYV